MIEVCELMEEGKNKLSIGFRKIKKIDIEI